MEPSQRRRFERLQADRDNLGAWTNAGDAAEFVIDGVAGGEYEIVFCYGAAAAGNRFVILVGDQRLTGVIQPTGGLKTYRPFPVGRLRLPAGRCLVRVQPQSPLRGPLCNFRWLKIMPSKG